MPISSLNRIPSPENGFTMVELMVVLFLMGLAASAVILNIGNSDRSAASQAERFAMRIAALRDKSVLESRPMAFWVRPSGYGFEQRQGRGWFAIGTKPFETTNWGRPMTAEIAGGTMMRIAFDSNGIPTKAAEWVLSDGRQQLRVELDETGKVHVRR